MPKHQTVISKSKTNFAIFKISTVAACGLLMSACAHHKDVRPGADGLHTVAVQTEDNEAGSREAIDQANHYCEQSGRSAAFVDENKKYTGDVDEATYKNAKMISKVAKSAGGAVWAMGGKKESRAGGVVGLGGQTVDSVLGEGYTVTMKFKCI
jgi:hypothetical protein